MAVGFKLAIGDSVALIAPASGQRQGQDRAVLQAIRLLEDWGLSVKITPNFIEGHFYLSADDKTRFATLQQAVCQPDIKAIFTTRGGYGCARLLPLLTSVKSPSRRFLIGYSDITTLHLQFANDPNMCCVHAPNLASEQLLGEGREASVNREALYRLLFYGELPRLRLTPLFSRDKNKASDVSVLPRTGGCLSLLVTSLGTAHEIDTTDKVLFIEEVGEGPYQVDRMLTHLQNAGKLESVKALIIGQMLGCQTATLGRVDFLREYFKEADFPVFLTKDFGHDKINLPWVYRP